MNFEVEITGKGTVGAVLPGWSVQEDASPVAIGDTSGGVGQISFSAEREPESELVFSNPITSKTDLGNISGFVQSTRSQGATIGLTHDTKLAAFLTERNIPSVGSGDPGAVLDMLTQLYGYNRCKLTNAGQRYWSLAGHDSAFDAKGKQFIGVDNTVARFRGDAYVRAYDIRDSVAARSYYRRNGDIHAGVLDGFSIDIAPRTVTQLAFKRTLSTTTSSYFTTGFGDSNNAVGTGKNVRIDLDLTDGAQVIKITGDYKNTSAVVTPLSFSTSLTGLNLTTGALQVVVTFNWVNENSFNITAQVANTSDYSTVRTVTTGTISSKLDDFSVPFEMGNVRALYYRTGNSAVNLMVEYENPQNFDVAIPNYATGYTALTGLPDSVYTPIVGGYYDGWEYLKQVAAGMACEYQIVNDRITVRLRGGRELDVNNVKNLEVNQSAAGVAQLIEVVNNNASVTPHIIFALASGRTKIYDARDDNTVWSIGVNEISTFTVNTDTQVSMVYNPENYTDFNMTDDHILWDFGVYRIIDSDNKRVPMKPWTEAGGDVRVKASPSPGLFDVIITGPASEIVNYKSPYRFASYDTGRVVAAFSVSGRGVIAKPEVISIPTGTADDRLPARTTQRITNVALGNASRAYDRVSWAMVGASSPSRSVSFDIPTSSVSALGYAPGSIFRYLECNWRVTSSQVDRAWTSITALPYTTIEDVRLEWNGATNKDFANFWSNYEATDIKQRPLFGGYDDLLLFPSLTLYPSLILFPR
jgi:hypothetical protein